MLAHKYFFIYKPFGILSQFSTEADKKTLADIGFSFPKDVYPVGRLDEDSEGLLILTNDKALNNSLLNPLFKHSRTYLIQVEGSFNEEARLTLENGIEIKNKEKVYHTLPSKVELTTLGHLLPERSPPIRFRKHISTSWISMVMHEGKNRQVRKMTAKVGFPTLRLVRHAIEDLVLPEYISGKVWEINQRDIYKLLKLKQECP